MPMIFDEIEAERHKYMRPIGGAREFVHVRTTLQRDEYVRPIGRISLYEDDSIRNPNFDNDSEDNLSDDCNESSDSSCPKNPTSAEENIASTSSYLMPFFVIVVILIAVFCALALAPKIKENPTDKLEKLSNKIYSLNKNFPQQSENTWASIASGIKDLYEEKPQKPCVILLFETISRSDTAECLATTVGKQVNEYMYGEDSLPVLEAAQFMHSDYGEGVQELKSLLSKNKVLIIKNLQDLSGSMVQSLHALCDRYNPLVSEALIVFTLRSEDVESSKNAAATVNDMLTDKWKDHVPMDKLKAIVSRVASRVVSVPPEINLPNICV